MYLMYREKRLGLLVFGVLFVSPLAAERVAIVTPDSPTFEEYAAAVHLEHHLGKVEGIEAWLLLEEELEPSLWRRALDRVRGRNRERDFRIWVGKEEAFEVPDSRFKVPEKEKSRESSTEDSNASVGADVPGVDGLSDHRYRETNFGSDPEERGMPDNDYTIRKWGRDIHIQGEGTAVIHAAYAFLEDHLGFRWFFPGELGEVVPEVSLRELSDFETEGREGFRSRQFSGLRVRESREWAVNNRLEPPGDPNRRYRFHHNVRRIFTPDLFDEHPGIFPVWDGERYRPPWNDPNWQPCFGHPKTAEIAAKAAREYFDANPQAISFSVGMNDGNRICECDLCQGLVAHGRTFRDKPDYSDLVFTFTNRVAELLEETHPDKYVGALAYHWAENTPSFPVHPQVIPYLTADRTQWVDERFRAEDQDLMERWMDAGPEIVGIYDYYYGGSFVIPRVFNAVMAKSIRHAHKTGIRGFYAELYPRWSLDGPKPWLAAQLLWDPEADPTELLDDYYKGFFGPAAAPMQEFFELAERRWTSQRGRPYWLRYYFQVAQLELYPPDVCEEARKILDAAVEAAGDREPYCSRVGLFTEGFRLTELYSRYYHFIHEVPPERNLSEEQGWSFLVDLMLYAEDFETLVRWKDNVMDRSFLHRESGEHFYERIGFKPEMRLTQWVEPLLEWGREYDAERLVKVALDRLDAALPAARANLVREIYERKRSNRSAGTDLLGNGNFGADRFLAGKDEYLGVRGRPPHDWNLWWRSGTQSGFFLSTEDTHRGGLGLRAEDAIEEYVYVNAPVTAEAVYRFSAHAKARISNGGRVLARLLWWDANGQLIETAYDFVDQLPEGENDWTRLEVVGEPPEQAVTMMAALAVENQDEHDFAVFDEVRLEEWEGRN